MGNEWDAEGGGRHRVRVKCALTTKDALRPPLYGLPKDHKPPNTRDGDVMATESINAPLSDVLAEILGNLSS